MLTESEEQILVMQWAELMKGKYPELEALHHIPNGGKRNIVTAVRMKKEGVKKGVPDLCLPVPRKGYHGLYIEMKRLKGKTSKEQDWWIEFLTKEGYAVEVCRGFEQAKDVIIYYLT